MKHRAGRRPDRESGVAAIEFVLVMPVLLLLFVGMISLTSYISILRKTSSAAELAADLVSRHIATIKRSEIDDYVTGTKQLFLPRSPDGISVEVYNFFKAESGETETRWKHPFPDGQLCTAPDTSSSEITELLTKGDVVVAVVCVPGYLSPADFLGSAQLGQIHRTSALRPRHTTTLTLAQE